MSADAIILEADERAELERLEHRRSTPQQLARRARIILLSAAGVGVRETGRRLGTWPKTVRRWRGRWLSSAAAAIAARLSDAPRPGAPARITPEQICRIVALACEKPEGSDRPISHWSQREVAEEAMRRGIVEQISQRSVGRFFKRIGT
jgi:transposase